MAAVPARPTSSRQARRAAARAADRATRAQPTSPVVARTIRSLPLASNILWGSVLLALLAFTATNIVRKITWYLAVDQFGYLVFAHDLLHGHVLHHWPPLDALIGRLPPRADILAQTYVADGARAYCRYSPGFPILLAAWLRIFGDDGAHYLNPSIFMALLVLLVAFGQRIFHSRWRALAAVAMVTLFPTYIHFWAITPTRDLSAHLAGFLGLYLLLPGGRHRLAGGLALGYAVTIRPDALLYLVPGGLVLTLEWLRAGRRWDRAVSTLSAAAIGLLIGLAPLLAYNWMTSGNPFRPTQAMEVERFFQSSAPAPTAPAPQPDKTRIGYPPPGWHGGTIEAVQGGGLRLSNLRTTLPGNVAILRGAYGNVMLAIAIWGAVVALVRRRTLFVLAVSYVLIGLVFFSFWSRPDNRYLSGVFCMLPLLIVEGTLGTLDVVRVLARRRLAARGTGLALGAAAALVVGATMVAAPRTGVMPMLSWIVPTLTAVALVAAAVAPHRRVAGVAAPVLAVTLAALGAWRAYTNLDVRGGFQRPEMLRARTTFARVVEPGAVVITTEDIGRPAENIEYYSGVAWALYFTDLARWGIGVTEAAERFAVARMKPYLLIPPTQPDRTRMLEELGRSFLVERTADIAPGQAMDYFVAAPFHRGVRLELYRLTPRG